MNWLTNYVRPEDQRAARPQARDARRISGIKCPDTGEMIFHRDLEANLLRHARTAGHHMRIGPEQRLQDAVRRRQFETLELPKVPHDPLQFRDEKRYADRLKEAQAKTGKNDAIVDALRPDRRPAGGGRGAGLRLHGRLAGHGRGRGARHGRRTSRRAAAKRPLIVVHRLRRRPHAGRHPVADADAAHHRRRRRASRKRACPISSC